MGLIARVLEQSGIATVMLSRHDDLKTSPPRVLRVPFGRGTMLGGPGDIPLQRRVLRAALDLLTQAGPEPVLAIFEA